MSIFKSIGNFLSSNPLKDVAEVVDRFVDTKEDKRVFFKEVFEMQSKERSNARNLYGKDSAIQKIYALVFLCGYMFLTGYFIYWAFTHSSLELTNFQISLISSIWGFSTSKVSTVTDFFFGASQEKRQGFKIEK